MKTKFLLVVFISLFMTSTVFSQVKLTGFEAALNSQGLPSDLAWTAQGLDGESGWDSHNMTYEISTEKAYTGEKSIKLMSQGDGWARLMFWDMVKCYDTFAYKQIEVKCFRENKDVELKMSIRGKMGTAGWGTETEIEATSSTPANNGWETLIFDFSAAAPGTYSSIAFCFAGNVPNQTVYVDDVYYVGEQVPVTVATDSPTVLNAANGYVGQRGINIGDGGISKGSVFGGNWKGGDYIYWNISVPSGYVYHVTGRNQTDTNVSFVVDLVTTPATQALRTAYKSGSGWSNYYDVTYGDLTLPAGDYQLKLKYDESASTGWHGMNLDNITLTPVAVIPEIIEEESGKIVALAGKASLGQGIIVEGDPKSIGSWFSGGNYVYWNVKPSAAGTFNVIADYEAPQTTYFSVNGTRLDFPCIEPGYRKLYQGVFSFGDNNNKLLAVNHDGNWINLRNFTFFRQGVTQDISKNIIMPVVKGKLGEGANITAATQIEEYNLSLLSGKSISFDVTITEEGTFIIPATPANVTYTFTNATPSNGKVDLSVGTTTITVTATADVSGISQFALTFDDTGTSIGIPVSDARLISQKYYNIQGVAILNPASGIYIVKKTYDNGVVNVEKVLIK